MQGWRRVEAQRLSRKVASHRGALKAPPVETHTPVKAESVLTWTFTSAAKITWVHLYTLVLHFMRIEG